MGLIKKTETKRKPPVLDPASRGEKPVTFQDLPEEQRWQSLFRAGVISATTQKFFNYVNLADQKAQALIILNSVLVPVALNWVERPMFHWSAIITVVTAVLSIMTAIICIYPKRRAGKKPDGSINLLHFGDIGRMKEEAFLEEFMPRFNDLPRLAEMAAKDLHDTARRIIRPKFYWLKLSYIIFFFGNLTALGLVLFNLWDNQIIDITL